MKLVKVESEIVAALLDGNVSQLLNWETEFRDSTNPVDIETVTSLNAADIEKLNPSNKASTTTAQELRKLAAENAETHPKASFKAFLKAASLEKQPPAE